ncbi:MAG TPA: hypothetical protein VHI77_01865 [Solirubrobacterales bacterium]|nr:hypothetical protein [Solirubrobacterales bacterium]
MTAHTAGTDGRPRLVLVRLIAFVLTVALVALLGFVRGAQAAPLGGGPLLPSLRAPAAEVEELDGEEESEEEEAGEEEEGDRALEEALAECEEVEGDDQREACEEEVEEQEAREECGLSEAASTASADPASGTLHVVVHYRAYSPGKVSVGYSLRGGKGSLNIGPKTERFARKGVFHDAVRLGKGQMAKVLAARQLTIELQALDAPDHCEGLFDQHVDIKRNDRSSRHRLRAQDGR